MLLTFVWAGPEVSFDGTYSTEEEEEGSSSFVDDSQQSILPSSQYARASISEAIPLTKAKTAEAGSKDRIV